MKKCLIGFIVVLTMILGINNVSALTGSDNNEYPSKPDDEYNNYFIYYTDSTCTDCSTNTEKGTYLFSYNNDNAFLTSNNWTLSNRLDINVYNAPPFSSTIPGESPSIGESNNYVSFKRYKLINGNWVLHLSGDNTYRKIERVNKMIYSTKDIYYRYDVIQSTYPSGNGFIPGTYKVTINGLEGAYQFKTYEGAGIEIKSFDEIINVNSYSQIEFTFNIPTVNKICKKNEIINGVLQEVEYECPLLDLNYDIRSVYQDGNDSSLSFGIPYLLKRYLHDTGSSSINKTDTIPLSDITDTKYIGNYIIDFDVSINKLKLIIPIEYVQYSFVKIYLESNNSFTVNYIERDTSFLETVDFSGKAGVMLIPKQIKEDMLVGFNFGVSSTYSLQLRDTYKDNYKVLKYYSIGYCDDRNYIDDIVPVICNSGSGGYQAYIDFKKDNLEQSIFVINRSYPSESNATLTYDNRYFVHVIYDTLESKPIIKHPITDEDIILGDLTDFDDYYTELTRDNFYTLFTEAFNYFKDSLIGIIEDVSYFWSKLPVPLSYFFILIFSFVLFLIFIKFLL